MTTRREFMAMAGAGLLLPGLARADGPADRRFLFVFCLGGWDTAYCLAPQFDKSGVDCEDDATEAIIGGIHFVDHEDRPSVRAFFEDHHDRTTIVNGFEVQSITHDRCMRLMFTGKGEAGGDDWGAILAANGEPGLLMPYTVISGPAYSARYSDQVVRVGASGQLSDLLAPPGDVLPRSEVPVRMPSSEHDRLVDAYVRERATLLEAAARDPRGEEFHGGYGQMLDNVGALVERGLEFSSSGETDAVLGQYKKAVDILESGLSRCVMVDNRGLYSGGWDTHSVNALQSDHYEILFGYLRQIMDELDARTGTSGAPLSEETVVVVCSEMGRGPLLNPWGGKDHFTYTSLMLVGGGLAGDRVVGGFDDAGEGLPLDLATAEPSDSGTALTSAHIGATLLALGDVDPAEYLSEEPILGLVD